MSEMVERVAQAICGDGNPANILGIHRDRARLAIEAMREPTRSMIEASDIGLENEFNVTNSVWHTIEFWHSMIDEALK